MSIAGILQNKVARKSLISFRDACADATTERADLWTIRYRLTINTYDPAATPVKIRTRDGLITAYHWSFTYHPWTREMVRADDQECVGQKAAQMGFTEVALNRALFTVTRRKRDGLYVLPAKTPDASDFSAARFDPALETSPELRRLFTNVNNMGLKRAGANSLYVRGSRSRSALKSIPVSFLVFDEVEEMEDEAIALGRERTSGQMDFQLWEISTPSVPGAGINALFERSRQEHFFFPCPSCRRHIQLTYPDCLVITGEYESDPKIKDSHLICPSCKAKLPHEEKPQYLAAGKWVSAHPDRDIRGFHVSQLYSCALHPSELAKAARRAEVSATYEQEFYNSKLGLPHIVAGSNVTIKDVNSCVWDYRMNEQSYISGENFLTLGIDVGTRCHFELTSWRFSTVADTIDVNEEAFGHVVFAGTFTDFREADTLIRKYRPRMTVIDNLPDTRASKVLAARFPRLVKLCSYSAASARDLVDHGEHVTVDRTTWLDLALGRFNAKRISLPQDIPHEYKQHMTSLVRIYRQHRTTGENIAMYKKTDDDHYAHARNYNEIALRLALASYGAPVAIEGRTF